jgi:hypothetical protein
MSIMTTGFHPSFDALSAYADQSDLDAARTRVGRHVARCASCSATVTEIRALGESVRGVGLCEAPEGLWARVEKQVREPVPAPVRETPSPAQDDVWRPAPALRPTVHQPSPLRRRSMRVALGVLAAAVVLFGVFVVMPGPSPLFATAASRIAFTPFRPAPGARVQVRYRPTPAMAKYDHVVLLGSYAGHTPMLEADYYFGGPNDSLAVLRRTPDGMMAGEFTVPSDFLSVALVVEDPTGTVYDGDGRWSWILVGGDARGKPALASLLAASEQAHGSGRVQQIYDTLQRYFPDHPAGYAMAKRYDGRGMFSDLLEFFTGAERKYAAFDGKLENRPQLDAERTVAMIAFANHIDEPGEAAKWTFRFTREHPDDPRALSAYGDMLHAMLVRGISADSVRRLLPRLDSLASLAQLLPGGAQLTGDGPYLIDQYGDDAMRRHWALLAVQRNPHMPIFWGGIIVADRWLADPEIHNAAMATLHRIVDEGCRSTVHYRRSRTNLIWGSDCLRERMWAFDELSRISLRDGQVSAARTFADSSIAMDVSAGGCFGRRGYRESGSAKLAAGDTIAAARAFAKSFWYTSSHGRPLRDSLMRVVAPAMDSARFNALVRSAEEEGRVCVRTRQALQKAAEAH